MSGEIAFGPKAVPKTLTVGELKNFWDMGIPKDIIWGTRLMQDHETIEELPLQAELTVVRMSDPEVSLRAQAAASALEGFDRNAILRDRVSDPASFSLEYTWCLIALEAVYGRDAKFWEDSLEFNIIPTLPNIAPPVPPECACPPKQIRKFRNGCWPNGDLFPAEPLLEALRALDHRALQRAVTRKTKLRNEFQPLAALHNLNSTLLGSWLNVAVRPLLSA